MPERPLTIATYAAGASLAAITLVYCFGPTFFLDDSAANTSRSTRKNGVVGLVNPANDCFINSILQALAGLPELRKYLIKEVHRRNLDGPAVYASDQAPGDDEQESKSKSPQWKTIGLQQGLVTTGLKEILDALNERPIYKKTISAQSFIRTVEQALRTRVSRSQQDAQEFLQVIVERLHDEFDAGKRARQRHATGGRVVSQNQNGLQSLSINGIASARQTSTGGDQINGAPDIMSSSTDPAHNGSVLADGPRGDDELFPMEGRLESQVECLHCHFKPKPTVSSFLTLTLNVPHDETSTTLNQCFDGMFKIEHIDDFTCDRCRLVHALEVTSAKLSKSGYTETERAKIQSDVDKIEISLQDDPESPPQDVKLPDPSTAPRRKITRHTRILSFPRILAVHLSRSVWNSYASSSKNMAKVSFPEALPLGGLLHRETYKLLGVVTHRGGHHSGHYESFRRQVLTPPFSTPASMGTEGIYSIRNSPSSSPRTSTAPSPHLKCTMTADVGRPAGEICTEKKDAMSAKNLSPTEDMHPYQLRPSQSSTIGSVEKTYERTNDAACSEATSAKEASRVSPPNVADTMKRASSNPLFSRNRVPKSKANERWWRISDDKIKECKVAEVLGMQREVYLLFYEIVADSS